MATTDIQNTAHDLEAAGIDQQHAAAMARAIVQAIPRRNDPSSVGILATATGLGFMLITVVFGWFMVEASQQRAGLRTAIEANRDRIDAAETRLSREIAGMSDRLTRIETLLEERLSEQR